MFLLTSTIFNLECVRNKQVFRLMAILLGGINYVKTNESLHGLNMCIG